MKLFEISQLSAQSGWKLVKVRNLISIPFHSKFSKNWEFSKFHQNFANFTEILQLLIESLPKLDCHHSSNKFHLNLPQIWKCCMKILEVGYFRCQEKIQWAGSQVKLIYRQIISYGRIFTSLPGLATTMCWFSINYFKFICSFRK
jgi:hypothetical protein